MVLRIHIDSDSDSAKLSVFARAQRAVGNAVLPSMARAMALSLCLRGVAPAHELFVFGVAAQTDAMSFEPFLAAVTAHHRPTLSTVVLSGAEQQRRRKTPRAVHTLRGALVGHPKALRTRKHRRVQRVALRFVECAHLQIIRIRHRQRLRVIALVLSALSDIDRALIVRVMRLSLLQILRKRTENETRRNRRRW